MNVEFLQDKNSLNNSVAVEGLGIFATEVVLTAVIKKMKRGIEGGPSGAISEMMKAKGREIATVKTELVNQITHVL